MKVTGIDSTGAVVQPAFLPLENPGLTCRLISFGESDPGHGSILHVHAPCKLRDDGGSGRSFQSKLDGRSVCPGVTDQLAQRTQPPDPFTVVKILFLE